MPEIKPAMKKLLKRNVEKLSNFKGHGPAYVKLIFKTADLFYREATAPIAVCKRGCSYCCHVPVYVTSIEASYIELKTGHKMNEVKEIQLLQPDGTACPFLKNNECSIYEFRPLNCRTFASVDSVEYCKTPDVKHSIACTDGNELTKLLNNMLTEYSFGHGVAPVADIRKWFGDNKHGS